LWFYGTIYNMRQSDIDERTKFLTSFLELPDLSKLVMNLRFVLCMKYIIYHFVFFSGGQLRRVSFAVALIHKSGLLILDEPTVGLDPLLRESIWDHLRELVKIEKTTILITTHYQEESKFCNRIGVMRRGQLLFEQNPCDLLTQEKTDSLSTAILQLCKKDEETARKDPERKSSHNKSLETFRVIKDTENHNYYNHKNYSSFEVPKSQNICSTWLMKELSVIFAIMYKSFLLYVRRPQ
jgi:ABC-type multidrug transport system ATPase subunit